MKRLFAILSISLTIALVQGCGFQLRGKFELPASLSALYVESRDASLNAEIEDMLRSSGNSPVRVEDSATAILKLFNVQYGRTVRTVDTRGKATGYVLNYSLDFNVMDRAGKTLLATRNVSLQRDYNYDSTQVLIKESEERYLRRDMKKDAALQIVRQLAAIRD